MGPFLPVSLVAAFLATADPPKPLTADERRALRTEWDAAIAAGKQARANAKSADALIAFERAAGIARRMYPAGEFPDGHSVVAASLSYVAVELTAQGRPADAERWHRDALAVYRRLYPDRSHPFTATALVNVGRTLEVQGKTAEAEPLFREAVEMRRHLHPTEDHPAKADVLGCLGRAVEAAGKPADAENLYREALEIRRRLHSKEDHPALASAVGALAVWHFERGNPTEAEPLQREALDMLRRLYPKQDHAEVATALGNLGRAIHDQARPGDAEPYLREALEMRERLHPRQDHPDVALNLSYLAEAQRDRRELADAQRLYERAVKILRSLHPKRDHPDLASALMHLGNVLADRGRDADAEPLFREALDMLRRVHSKRDHSEVARCTNALAGALFEQGQLAEADRLYRDALVMRQRLYPNQDHPSVATSLSHLADAVRARGGLPEAELLYRNALAMWQRLHPKRDHEEVANSLGMLANVLAERGQAADAESHARESLAMIQRLHPKQDHFAVAARLTTLAGVLIAQGKPGDAEKLLRDSLDMRRRLHPKQDHPDVATGLNNLAAAVYERGSPADAEPLLREAADMLRRLYPKQDHPTLAGCLGNLGRARELQGKAADAEGLFRESLDMLRRLHPGRDHPAVADALSKLAHALASRGDWADAGPLSREALGMARRLTAAFAEQSAEGEALTLAAALPLHRDAYLTTELALKAKPADVYTEVWADKGAVSRVYEQRQLRARAATDPSAAKLLATLADARRRRAELLLAPATNGEGTLKKREEELKAVEAAIRQADEAVRPRLPAVGRAEQLRKATASDLQKGLPADAAVVDYLRWVRFEFDPKKPGAEGVRRRAEYMAFVITRTGIRWVDLGPAAGVEKAVAAWRAAITGDAGAKVSPSTAEAVHELGATAREFVWNPVRKNLPAAIKTVYVCPDRDLCRVPWAALPGDKPGTILLEEFAIATIPHAPFLLDRLWPQDERKNPPAAALAVGGVKYDAELSAPLKADAPLVTRGAPLVDEKKKSAWVFLSATVGEAGGFVKAAEGKKVPVESLAGEKATTAAVLAALPKAKYAHLATHGFFADKQFRSAFQLEEKDFVMSGRGERIGRAVNSPLVMTGLVLAGANRPRTANRGIVTGEALVDLDLSGLELTVLSACETGLGDDITAGEGTFGLQRAFHHAGTQNVIASLWKVDDTATAALMGEFYRQLWELNQPPVEALRQAQLAVYRADAKRIAELTRRGFESGEKDLSKLPLAPDAKGGNHPALWAAFTLSGLGK